jgi:hypothetical protein
VGDALGFWQSSGDDGFLPSVHPNAAAGNDVSIRAVRYPLLCRTGTKQQPVVLLPARFIVVCITGRQVNCSPGLSIPFADGSMATRRRLVLLAASDGFKIAEPPA